jgi:hypothetical protein
MIVKEGSRWSGNNGDMFHVIHVVEIEGHTWVHYIKEKAPEDSNREYSCYLESFLQRFRSVPD